MPKNLMMEMGSQVGLTPANRTAQEAEEWSRRMNGHMLNPSFEPDEFSPQSLSPVEDSKKGGADKGIFMVELKDKGLDDEDYEPYENRTVKKPTTNTETLLHLLKGSLGTGILAMPRAFQNSGWAIGIVGTIFIGLLCTYCIHMLIDSCYTLCKRRRQPSMSYTAAAEAALSEGPEWCQAIAPYAGHVVNTFLLIYQIGTCCVYVVFVSENIKAVIDVNLGTELDVRVLMCGILLPLVLINWIRNLKYLAPLSALANLITLVSFACILYYLFKDTPSLDGKYAVGNLVDFPLFFGTVLFALEAIGVILPLENAMKTPKDFVGKFGVLNQAMISIIILYVGMGMFGYLQYGDATLGSITLNLPEVQILAQAVQCMLAFSIFITHGLACYVAIDIAWNEYIRKRVPTGKIRLFWEYFVRTCIVLLTFGLAAAVPNLELFISLFGALCLSALGLAFPAVIQMSTYWYHVSESQRMRMLIKNVLVFVFGILGLVIGTYTSMTAIVHKLSENPVEDTESNTLSPFFNSTAELSE